MTTLDPNCGNQWDIFKLFDWFESLGLIHKVELPAASLLHSFLSGLKIHHVRMDVIGKII